MNPFPLCDGARRRRLAGAVTLAATAADRVRLVVLDVTTLKPTVLAHFADSDLSEFHRIDDHGWCSASTIAKSPWESCARRQVCSR